MVLKKLIKENKANLILFSEITSDVKTPNLTLQKIGTVISKDPKKQFAQLGYGKYVASEHPALDTKSFQKLKQIQWEKFKK